MRNVDNFINCNKRKMKKLQEGASFPFVFFHETTNKQQKQNCKWISTRSEINAINPNEL